MANITEKDILKLANLSKLKLSSEQVVRFRKDIEELLKYVEQLNKVDTAGLEPTDQVTGLTNSWREDVEISYQAKPEDLLKAAPFTEDNQIKVKRVIE